ncbi:hypothetical protein ANAPC1_00193 [Anaplasma phagocytophilum]|uniref:Uncharacterized protein n=1 Tax=Anaplasma phagocytophilum TaxID=948 RepID=A0AA45ZH28_ANAPH|nr:hypothetical protein ANAPC1_00193 [Anaplasma phagocytophilum]SBO30785.1 hypothetical protein ANAPC3_00308 [Anaplasma phagocytophilum]SBO32676.1 hypothetical protein ANAPC2_01109 [Anaplasma phagocytophilum]SCV63856.1 hypothetical protein ANAPH2_00768 [Anaplasma phagocytophilum]SCV64678.1 hypothetical protein ANAPC5_00935 [Anaplasma phagocytophilum]
MSGGDKPDSVLRSHSSGICIAACLMRLTRATNERSHNALLSLAPGSGYLATACYHEYGALLPHLFTLTPLRGGSFLWP